MSNLGESDFQRGAIVGGGRFVLERELGRGGMGVVWLAQDEHLRDRVALKFLSLDICEDETALDGMRQEVLKSRQISHRAIVRIHDFHEQEGEPPFISMEYVDGQTLGELRLRQATQTFPWDYLKPLVQQLCDALEYAHCEGIIHRDIKPANLMLDGKGRVKLTDFGIAAALESASALAPDRPVTGTMTHMSPQQLDGEAPAVTDDIYALGATLYELLASKPPFDSGDMIHQIHKTAAKPIGKRLAELGIRNDVPEEEAAMVMACLSKDPGKRPQSAHQVAEWVGLEVRQRLSVPSLVQRTRGGQLAEVEGFEAELGESAADEAMGAFALKKSLTKLALIVAGFIVVGGIVGILWNGKLKRDKQAQFGDGSGTVNGGSGESDELRTDRPWTNSLGMAFAPVIGTDAMFSVWETRVKDYEVYARSNAGVNKEWKDVVYSGEAVTPGPVHPVVNVSWEEARAFCSWLTDKEAKAGLLPTNVRYRLPTDEEWSVAAGLPSERGASPKMKHNGARGVYPWGSDWPPPPRAGNFNDQSLKQELPRDRLARASFSRYRDGYATASPVGRFEPGKNGLHDLSGNVWEWCEDYYDPMARKKRVLRGGSWSTHDPNYLLTSSRISQPASFRSNKFGFRVVMSIESGR